MSKSMSLKPRFSLRSLAIVLTLICVLIGAPIGYIRYRAERQRRAISRLQELEVGVAFAKELGVPWLTTQARHWIDPDAFRPGLTVRIDAKSQNLDEIVSLLPDLDGLEEVLSQSPLLNDEHLRVLSSISTLNMLAFAEANYSTQSAAALLKRRQWKHLTLPSAKLDDAMLAELGQMKNLTHLCFDASNASPEAISGLANCTSLENVFVNHCVNPGAVAKAARSMPTLKSVMISNSVVDADNLREFGDIGALRTLQFLECKIDSAGVDALKNATSLTHLEFYKSPVSVEVVDSIADLPALRIFAFDGKLTDDSLTKLSTLRAIQLLGFLSCEFTDEGLMRLAKTPTLRTVLLPQDTKCTEAGIRRLQEKSPIRVVIGNINDGIHYVPGGKTEDRRKPQNQ